MVAVQAPQLATLSPVADPTVQQLPTELNLTPLVADGRDGGSASPGQSWTG